MQMKKSNIYIGEIIKNVMSERQVTKAELARRLDVKPQSVDYLLTRKSIDTDTLYNISIALDYDFSLLYSIKQEQRNSDNEGIRYKLGNAKIMVEIELQQDEIIKLNLKKKIAELLDGRTTSLTNNIAVQQFIGKQPAWIDYMTNINKAYGNFRTNENFMILSRQYEVDNAGNLQNLTTYIDPSLYNGIFADQSFNAQNFWVQLGVDIKARRLMSAKVIPNL